jgi:hypothetical protein
LFQNPSFQGRSGVLQPGTEVNQIVNIAIAAIAVVDGQEPEKRLKAEPNSSPKPLSKEEQTLPLERDRMRTRESFRSSTDEPILEHSGVSTGVMPYFRYLYPRL